MLSSGCMCLLAATRLRQDGTVVLISGLALRKLLQAGHHKVHDHEEYQARPRASAAHDRHVAPQPSTRRRYTPEIVRQPLPEPPAMPGSEFRQQLSRHHISSAHKSTEVHAKCRAGYGRFPTYSELMRAFIPPIVRAEVRTGAHHTPPATYPSRRHLNCNCCRREAAAIELTSRRAFGRICCGPNKYQLRSQRLCYAPQSS